MSKSPLPLYWLLTITIAVFYSIVLLFMANGLSYLDDTKFGMASNAHKSARQWRVTAVYGVSMLVSVALGAFVDWFGRRTPIAIIETGLTLPIFYLLAYTDVDPALSMVLLGCNYSVCAAALWSSI